ncbi:hypothetical protein [Paracoccus denitrificans]|jgi:hypothetical protein|uniref:hypothetical protein n=1 Tax=Paracoccus denitrificans TaxID=266 RepID=UPI00031F8698|nr:hypothetical protein [Paracoccus denitrificans]MBB4627124.1 hypothetical protein [Paracoccus denitrificans]MCU7430813.1 hypothetical protein [Paracoccus denitrificans]QAR25420.1 hypothetical protein EO213_03340 [Paracoccus denitrificans]UPV94307.1 hypothetical protein M0K93_10635 [Paracoccus denitrificans]WQO33650.1 hypothetical protein U0005_00810 [Paracoccus denitrificans]
MQKILALIVILALALGGLWLWNGGDPTRLAGSTPPAESPATPAAPAADQPPAQESANAAADAAADAAAIAADAAADASISAGQAAVGAAGSAAEQAEAAAEAAIAAADRAADAAAAANATPEQAEAAAVAASEAVGIDAALTPQGFDAGKVRTMIEQSGLSAERKAGLIALLDNAALDPAALAQALDQIKAALP